MVKVTQAEFARARGVSEKQVNSFKSQGYLVYDSDGSIDIAASNALLDEREKNPPRRKPRDRSPAERVTAERSPAATPPERGAIPSLAESRKRKEHALAERRELELAIMRKEWFPVAKMQPLWSGIIISMRQAVLTIPSLAHMNLGLAREQTKGLTVIVRDVLTRCGRREPPLINLELDHNDPYDGLTPDEYDA
jgi:hypothetical protein